MKTLPIIFFILFLSQYKSEDQGNNQSDSEDIPEIEKPPSCNPKILNAFDVDSLKYPKMKEKVLMCDKLENTCCNLDSQIQIFYAWKSQKDQERLQKRFRIYYRIYNEILKVLETSSDIIDKFIHYNTQQGKTNCFVIAESIQRYNIKDIVHELRKEIIEMYSFFMQSYDGVFCALCNANNGGYFDLEKKKITMTGNYCENLVQKTMSFQMYYKVYFAELLNLISRFFFSCDFMNNFTSVLMNKNIVFKASKKVKKSLHKCMDNYKLQGIKKCFHICQNFNLLKFKKFFYPSPLKFASYSIIMNEKIEDYLFLEEQYEAKKKSTLSRILEQQKNINTLKNQRMLQEKDPEKINYKLDFSNEPFFPNTIHLKHQLQDEMVFTAYDEEKYRELQDFKMNFKNEDGKIALFGVDLQFEGLHTKNSNFMHEKIIKKKIDDKGRILEEKRMFGFSKSNIDIFNMSFLLLLLSIFEQFI